MQSQAILDHLANEGYLVMEYPDNTVEIFDRQYKSISDNPVVANTVAEYKVLVHTWDGYTGSDCKTGLGKWYQHPYEVREDMEIVNIQA